jgi:hypothetical protein
MVLTIKPLREIRTDDPIKETWSMLSYFESKHNCLQYLEERFGKVNVDSLSEQERLEAEKVRLETADHFAFTASAAREYYEAADRVTILTRPLLIFYGMASLSKVLFIAAHGKKSPSTKHGLQKCKGWNGSFSELSVQIGKDGTFPQFHGCFCKESLSDQKLSMKELLSLIPEVKVAFEKVYHEKSQALGISRIDVGISIMDSELDKYTDLENCIDQVPGINDRYADRQMLSDRVILWCKDHKAKDPTVRSISGEEYLVLPLRKNMQIVDVPEMSSHFLIMFLLGMLSRYDPKEWGRVIKAEESGEIYVVQKFLEVTKRKFPNLILNELQNRDFVFISPTSEDSKKLDVDQLDKIYEYVSRKMAEEFRRRL